MNAAVSSKCEASMAGIKKGPYIGKGQAEGKYNRPSDIVSRLYQLVGLSLKLSGRPGGLIATKTSFTPTASTARLNNLR